LPAVAFFLGQEQYSPGLTVIIAKEYTRQALFEALYNRSCYATTGERIVLGLFLAGLQWEQNKHSRKTWFKYKQTPFGLCCGNFKA
jgi:hypothetical protein